MKRSISLILAFVMVMALVLPVLPEVAFAADPVTVYVSASGNDANDGLTREKAVKSLNRAYDVVYKAHSSTASAGTTDTNTIIVLDDLGTNAFVDAVCAGHNGTKYLWSAYVNVTIRGEGENAGFTISRSYVTFSGNAVFDNLNIKMAGTSENDVSILSYKSLTINDNVKVSGTADNQAYAGKIVADKGSVLNINAGKWYHVSATSTGDTANITIGGTAEVTNLSMASYFNNSATTVSRTGVSAITVKDSAKITNLYAGGWVRANSCSYTLSTVNVNVNGGSVENLYLGGVAKANVSGSSSITNLNFTQTGGTITNVYGTGYNNEGATATHTVTNLNATFAGTPAINFTVANMPATAMNLTFGDVKVNFDADDLAAVKEAGVAATTLTVGKTTPTSGYDLAYSVAMSDITATADVTVTMASNVNAAEGYIGGSKVADMDTSSKQIAFAGATLGQFDIKITDASTAQIGDTIYKTIGAALGEAQPGDTVTLLADAGDADTTVVIPAGVSLYVDTYTLTAKYIIGLEGSKLGGKSLTGKLDLPSKDALKLAEGGYTTVSGETTYYAMPMWDEANGYYTFSAFSFFSESQTVTTGEGSEMKITFAHNTVADALEMLETNGGSAYGLSFIVQLRWTAGGVEMVLNCNITDDLIKSVSGASNQRFTVTLNGFEELMIDAATMEAQAMIVSDCGATAYGQTYVNGAAQ